MAASMSTIQLLENHEQWQQLYKILAEANPANQSIQRELGKLSNNKDTYIAQLKLQLDSRPVPRGYVQLFIPVPKRKIFSTNWWTGIRIK